MIPKLFQWLLAGVAFLAIWISLVLTLVDVAVINSTKDIVILFLPVILLVAFAFYSIFTIGYRVATFNDCLEAAEELQTHIKEAQTDLKAKGFKFD